MDPLFFIVIGLSAFNFLAFLLAVVLFGILSKNAGRKAIQSVETELKENRKELNDQLFQFAGMMSDNQAKMNHSMQDQLGQSFKLMGERLEAVQRGLGEMHELANGVGDLKKVLSNVKTKGVLGELQLGRLLDEMLTPAQYGKNVKTKEGSRDLVEFAVKIPSKVSKGDFIWLPIDSKFPTEDYDRLLTAYDAADGGEIERCKKALAAKIKLFAKEIAVKYIDVPHTTDFGILFLPIEGLYAEVLRIPGLFETVQRELKITITGPTTLSAFISSLQMGFRTLAIEKRTQEIWDLLGAVKTEFGKFGESIERVQRKIEEAGKECDRVGVRTRAIQRQLKEVELLPEGEKETDR